MRKALLVLYLYVLVALLSTACANIMPTQGSDSLEPFIYLEWDIAIERLALAGVQVPLHFSPNMFHIRPMALAVKCGDVMAYGCFSTPNLIRYWIDYPNALRHEFSHGILYKMGLPWKEWEHEMSKLW